MRMPRDEPRANSLRSERGTTMVELLVFTVMLLGVLGIVSFLIIMSTRLQPEISKKNQQVQQATALQLRLSRELRQGSTVDSATASAITFRTFVRHTQCGGTTPPAASVAAILCKVTYACTAGTCTRSETNTAGTITPWVERLVTGISNSSSVFTYLPDATDPNYVTTTLVLPNDDGDDNITLTDGAELRNR
jgi:type II secretory pathway pseudopilin PulG